MPAFDRPPHTEQVLGIGVGHDELVTGLVNLLGQIEQSVLLFLSVDGLTRQGCITSSLVIRWVEVVEDATRIITLV